MASITELIELQQHQRGQINQGGGSGAFEVLTNIMKQKEDERRRQENVKKQMSNTQQMMQAMAQMKDNSASGKVLGTMDDSEQKRRKGVITVSDYTPSVEQGIGEDGMPYFKASIKSATPQEQRAQVEMQKSKMEIERSNAKSDLLSAYVKDQVQEGAILGEMSTLGITADEFDIAVQAKERLKSIVENQTFSGKPVQIPNGQPVQSQQEQPMDQNQPASIPEQVQQPVVQPRQAQKQEPFRFKTEKTIAEQKFQSEQAETNKKAQLEGDMVKESAQDTLDTISEIENGLRYFGAAGNIPAFPAEYSKQNWQANLDKLQSKLVVDLMNRMKQASRTGATGFGALSEKELKVLQNAATALKKGMSEPDAQKYLNEIKTKAQKVLGGELQSTSNGSVPSVGGSFNGEKVISVKRIR